MMVRKRVVFPEPEGPRMTTTSPSSTERSTPFKISTPPSFFLIFFNSTIAISSVSCLLYRRNGLLITIHLLIDPFQDLLRKDTYCPVNACCHQISLKDRIIDGSGSPGCCQKLKHIYHGSQAGGLQKPHEVVGKVRKRDQPRPVGSRSST